MHIKIYMQITESPEYGREEYLNLYYLCMPFSAAWLGWDGMCSVT